MSELAEQLLEDGRFEIVGRLGEGGGGTVYEAYDRRNQVQVALKTLRTGSSEELLLLKREFRSIQDLAHPNLVKLGELFEHHGQWFFTMERVHGLELPQYVRPQAAANDGHVDERGLRACFAQLVRALEVLHRAHKVHRDVKGSNVLVEPDGRVVLLDFGVIGDDLGDDDQGMVGTVEYMAPEQILGDPVGPAADLYAVGVLLYECLTGRPPFEGEGDDVLEAKLLEAAEPPAAVRPEVPADLSELCARLLATDPGERPSAEEVLRVLEPQAASQEPSAAGSDSLFVGRGSELRALEAAFQQGGCATVVVRGESGVGKSHLVAHFVEQALERVPGTLALQGRCYERESVPYKGIDSIIDGMVRVLEDLPDHERRALVPEHAHLLQLAFPVLSGVLDASPDPDQEALVPRERRERVFAGLRQLLHGLAGQRRLVLVIDDIQWANADGIALLQELMRPPAAPEVLWILMARTEAESGKLPELPGEVQTLEVERLDAEDAAALARELISTRAGMSSTAVEQVIHEAQGHPLFLTELLRFQPSSRGALMHLDEVLWMRVSCLPERDRQLVEALATAGAPIPRKVLQAATGAEPGELFNVLHRLQVDKLTRSLGSGASDMVAIFHDRVRESVSTKLSEAAQCEWHRRLASAMEREGGVGPEALSYHFEHSGNRSRAAHYMREAAERSYESLAFERAAQSFAKLRELAPLEGAERTEVELKLAQAWTNAGHGAKASAVRLELAKHVGGEVGVEQRLLAGGDLLMAGYYNEGVEELKGVFAELGLPYPKTKRRVLIGLLGRRLQIRMNVGRARVRRADRRDTRLRLRAEACWAGTNGLNLVDSIYGNYYSSLHTLYAMKLGDPRRLLFAFVLEGLSGGGPNRKYTERMLARATEVAAELGTVEAEAMLAAGSGASAYFWGEWGRAVPELTRALSLLREQCVGLTYFENTIRFMLFRALLTRGDFQALREQIPPALREAQNRNDRYTLVNIRATESQLDCADGSYERAQEHLKEAMHGLPEEGFHVQHYLCFVARAQTLLHFGEYDAALEAMQACWPQLERAFLLRISIIGVYAHDTLARCALAVACAQPGRSAEMQSILKACLRGLGAIKDPWAKVFIDGIVAARAVMQGRPEQAASALRSMVERAEQNSMALHAACARMRLGAMLQGDEGAALHARGLAYMREQAIADADQMLRFVLPLPGAQA